jgi:hypothetical protein
MVTPPFADSAELVFTLFARFWQHAASRSHRGRPFVYQPKALLVFCVVMPPRRPFRFTAPHRWLQQHPALRQHVGLQAGPTRTTLSRRYKESYPGLQDFLAFLGQYAADLAPQFTSHDRYTEKSLFTAQGPVWHQSDRQAGRLPDQLRHLDTEASWSKSGDHGWVDGDGLHLVHHRVGFPQWGQLETAAVAARDVIDHQATPLLQPLRPETVTTENSDAKARRLRPGAPQGVVLRSPAVQWGKGRYALASHRSSQPPENAALIRSRRTAIAPVFDLIAHVLGTKAKQKQWPIHKLAHVRTC